MVFVYGGEVRERARGSHYSAGMSDPKRDRDSDRDSLTGWTLVDREGTPEDTASDSPQQEEDEEGAESTVNPEGAAAEVEDEEEEESGCGMDEDEEGGEDEPLPDDLVSMGQRVQEIKEEGDVESIASTDSLIDAEKDKLADEETDLSLASSPSLPDDLPAIKPDTQYKHIPDKDLNSRLNIVVALTLACVLGLGIGHFLGWSSRSIWQESMNSAQILDAMNLENEQLESEIILLQRENIAPIKIRGKDGKHARSLRERINHLIVDNEELRMAVGKLQFANFPDSDTNAFSSTLEKNYNLRLAAGKLTHLGPDLNALKVSANDLQAENQELKIQVGKLRYQQQPLPQELNAVAREIEKLKKTVDEASQKKNVPPNLNNAKTYVSYMSQILSAIHTLHEFEEGSLAEKIDVAADVFEDLAPGNVKLNSQTRQKLNAARSKFSQIQASLSRKWEKLKELSQPEKLAAVSRDTLTKMNRVIINVVNKVKEIGRTNILRRGKASLEKTINTLTEQLATLGLQFDKTWKDLEDEVVEESDKEPDVAAKIEDKVMKVAEVVVIVPEEAEATRTEDEQQLLMDEEEVVEDRGAKKELPAEVEPEDEVVVTAKAKKESVVVKQAGKKGVRVEEIASKQPSAAAVKPPKGREGRRGGGGGEDKKKLPDDKKEKEIKEVKEKVEEKKPVDKRRRSRRSRVSEKEEKKEKKEKEAQKENESNEKQKIYNKQQKKRESKKSKDKQNGHGNQKDKSRNYHQRNERDRNIQKKDEPQRYYKGQYNKYDKKYHHHDDYDDDDDDDDDDGYRYKKKHYTQKYDDDEDDDDDSDYKKRHYAKYNDDESNRQKGLMRHWQKPSKKNYHREYSGPKKTFIRRRGKNHTQHYNGEWSIRRATGREHKRREEQKAEWLFERAKDRKNLRENEQKADWQFNRAQGRKDMRFNDEYQAGRFHDYDRYGHARYEKHETRRRYVRFDDDDDDDDDEYYDHKQQERRGGHGVHEYNKGKGQREWVIPNFSATGKTYYR